MAILLLGPSLAAASGGSAWTPAVRERMAADALKVAPPTLARFVLRHFDSFKTGLRDAAARGEITQHRQMGDETTGAATALELTERWAAVAMEERRPISVLVYRLGVVAHYAADLNDPLLTSQSGGGAAFGPDYAGYVEENLHLYPAVFYGYPSLEQIPPAGENRMAVVRDGMDSAEMARGYFPHLERAYSRSGGSSDGFDVRSIPFGIASLSYSRAVTGVARSWLRVWVAARGDLSGTPHLQGAPPVRPGMRRDVSRTVDQIRKVREAATPKPPAGAEGAASAATDPDRPPAHTKTIYGKSRRERTKQRNDASKD